MCILFLSSINVIVRKERECSTYRGTILKDVKKISLTFDAAFCDLSIICIYDARR